MHAILPYICSSRLHRFCLLRFHATIARDHARQKSSSMAHTRKAACQQGEVLQAKDRATCQDEWQVLSTGAASRACMPIDSMVNAQLWWPSMEAAAVASARTNRGPHLICWQCHPLLVGRNPTSECVAMWLQANDGDQEGRMHAKAPRVAYPTCVATRLHANPQWAHLLANNCKGQLVAAWANGRQAQLSQQLQEVVGGQHGQTAIGLLVLNEIAGHAPPCKETPIVRSEEPRAACSLTLIALQNWWHKRHCMRPNLGMQEVS
ncbi:hypothetical protein L7F22_021711 [Adiantum nelumboides]|nr:hypothetical protein [Adiantum nelumboides]